MKPVSIVQPRNRVIADCGGDSLTDQSYKRACDINVIMLQYEKTGMLPHFPQKVERYLDCTQIPTLESAFETVSRARELFYDLPAPIRLLMENDPSKLESFIADPENFDLLVKHGVLVKRAPDKKPEATLNDVVDALKSKNSQESANVDPKKQ